MLTVQARLSDVNGKGVGRWRNYYRAADMQDAKSASRHLVPSAQIRVLDGKTVVVTPMLAEEFLSEQQITAAQGVFRLDSSPHTVKAFELSRPYVFTVGGETLYVLVTDVHTGETVAHPAIVAS
jgi:hypothetical protein